MKKFAAGIFLLFLSLPLTAQTLKSSHLDSLYNLFLPGNF
jgi:hypothetical protein